MIDEVVACVNNLRWDKTILLYYAFSPLVAYNNLPKLYNNQYLIVKLISLNI